MIISEPFYGGEVPKMELYTIGYEGLSQKGFIGFLNAYNITIVADVRKIPSSRKKGFSKTSLAASLSEHNIEYMSFPELGTPKEMRARLKATGDYEAFFEEFKDTLSGREEQLKKICALINSGERVGLLCFEQDPYKCHRRVVADEVKRIDRNALKIKHLRSSH